MLTGAGDLVSFFGLGMSLKNKKEEIARRIVIMKIVVRFFLGCFFKKFL